MKTNLDLAESMNEKYVLGSLERKLMEALLKGDTGEWTEKSIVKELGKLIDKLYWLKMELEQTGINRVYTLRIRIDMEGIRTKLSAKRV